MKFIVKQPVLLFMHWY